MLRRALEAQLDASAREMAEDILERGLVPGVDEVVVQEISNMTIRYILFRAMDYIEQPEQRERIQVETERFINRQFRGALIEELDSGQILALKQAPAAD